MPRVSEYNLFCLAALAAIATNALIEVAQWVNPLSLSNMGLVSIGLAVVSLLLVGFSAWRGGQERNELRKAFQSLCQSSPSELAASIQENSQGAGSLPDGNPWFAEFQQLRSAIGSCAEQMLQSQEIRMRSEIRLHRATHERDRLAEILSSLPDPILAVENDNGIALMNAAAEKLLGLETVPADQRTLERIEHCQELLNLVNDSRRRRLPGQRVAEFEVADPTGQRSWYSASCRVSNEHDAGNGAGSTAPGAVAVLRNIGNQKAVQKRHAEFVAAVSHEMKTPLASIRAYTELLADGEAEDEATREEFLGIISAQADRLRRLIDNLLNLARIEAGVVQVQKQPISLNQVAEEACLVLQHAAAEKNVGLQSDLSQMYLGVHADRDLLQQAIINLLSNGIKYTSPGGKVILRSRLVDDTVEFEVEDSGVGLSPEDQTRVFEKFYRVKKDAGMAQGTGLGLPLVKHIVEDVHGGAVSLTSELGKGSTFRVTLPKATGDRDAPNSASRTPAGAC